MLQRFAVAASVSAALFSSTALTAPQPQSPSTYNAVVDRGARPEPPLIHLGPAGFSFNDPVFGSRIWRVTDGLIQPDRRDVSYHTPSSPHQNEWSADGTLFYVLATGGTVIPFSFDATTGTTAPLDPLRFYVEPQFSYVEPRVIYGSENGSDASLRIVERYDFSTGKYTQLLDLNPLEPNLRGTYVGGIASSAGATERILAFFGGPSQDLHHYLVVFDRADPGHRHLLDTMASTLDGQPTSTLLLFHLHHAAIDRSGRYVMLYPSAPELVPPRSAAQVYVWALDTNAITPLPPATAHSGGHDAFGYGVAVNKDCCASSSNKWDAAEWERRSLATPLAPSDIIVPTMQPAEVNLSDHTTWNNARPDALVPFITATYRYGNNTAAWRPWDDEIMAVETDVSGGDAEVWRFAQHRSDVRSDTDPSEVAFWYEPRPNVSMNGRWVLFTSNWEKTLGTDAHADATERARQDVFLLQLKAPFERGCGDSSAPRARGCQ
jgi:hypothetical protein